MVNSSQGPQTVLLLGSSGFIGAALKQALERAGYLVRAAARRADSRNMTIDFTRDHEPGQWVPRLAGVDIVINAVGIFTETRLQTFKAVHTAAPCALFSACVTAGVSHVVQISALGAASRSTRYFDSKRDADECLMALPLGWSIVTPSLVYGPEGASSAFLRMMASLPLVPVPGEGAQIVQPIHVDDLADLVVAIVQTGPTSSVVAAVGPSPLTWREYLDALRSQLGLGRARFTPIPRAISNTSAWLAGHLPGSLLSPDALKMLEQGSAADVTSASRLLGHPPRPVASFIPPAKRRVLAQQARLGWLLPLLPFSMAVLWIASGVVSLWGFPRAESLALLGATGIPEALQPAALYTASSIDILLGLGCLLMPGRPGLWLVQIATVLAYTAILTFWLPGFWLHPFGPLTKNIPVLALLVLLYFRARDRWTI